jgi:hypothetical protein
MFHATTGVEQESLGIRSSNRTEDCSLQPEKWYYSGWIEVIEIHYIFQSKHNYGRKKLRKRKEQGSWYVEKKS